MATKTDRAAAKEAQKKELKEQLAATAEKIAQDKETAQRFTRFLASSRPTVRRTSN